MAATADVIDLNRKVLSGRSAPLPKRPRGDTDDPEKAKFVRRVTDLQNPEQVCAAVCARARSAAEFRRVYEEEWRKAIRAWFQRSSEEREDSWESDRFLPIVFKHVETALPSLVAATLDGRRIWVLEGMTRQGKDAAVAQGRLLNWQAFTVSGCEEAYEDLYWWAAVIGTSYIDHYWDYREERRYGVVVRETTDPATGQTRKVKEVTEQDMVVADHPRVVCLNPLDVYPDPESQMGDENEWYVERVRTTIGALRDAAGQGHIDGEALEAWIEEFKPETRATEDGDWFDDLVSDTWDEWLREMGYEGRGDTIDPEDVLTAEKPVTVLRYRSKREIITLGSRQHIIGYSVNPHIHGKTGIITHHFIKVPNSPFGRGVGTVLLGHQALANENINRFMDVAAVEAMAPIIVDRSAVSILDDEFVFEPNKIIRARGTEAVKRMDVAAPTNLAMLLDQHLAKDADDVTGFTEQARGMAPSSGQTATAFSGLQNNIRTRLVLHVRRAARTIRQSGELLLALNQQFMTERQVVSLVGEEALDYVAIEPWEIVGKTVVRATLNASRANPELRAQRLVALTQVVLPILQAQGDPAVVFRWARMLLEENDVENVDLLIPRSTGKARDPLMENEALKRGIRLDALPAEDHALHIQAHGGLHEELLAMGAVGAASVVAAHVQTHLLLAQQQAMAMAASGQVPEGPAGGPGGGNTEGEVAGSATDGAAARDGTPGVASPGPAGAPGRPPAKG